MSEVPQPESEKLVAVELSAEMKEFDLEATQFCHDMRTGITQRDTDLIRALTPLVEQLAHSSQANEFKRKFWDVIVACPIPKKEKTLAEFRKLVIEGYLDHRYPELRPFLAQIKYQIVQGDAAFTTRFYETELGQFHHDLLKGSEDFQVSETESETAAHFNTYLDSEPGQQIITKLLGDLKSEFTFTDSALVKAVQRHEGGPKAEQRSSRREGLLFAIQRQRLVDLTARAGMTGTPQQQFVEASISHLKEVTYRILELQPGNWVAALAAAVHDYYKHIV